MPRDDGGKGKGKGKEKVKINRSRDKFVPLLKGQRPGGPVCDELHISYDAHVARNVWRYGSSENFHDRGVMKMHQRQKALDKWEVDETEQWWEIVEASGLEHLRTCLHTNIDAALISAFVERWCPETNSFHMWWGEMTITLHDVWHILRLNIDGKEVELDKRSSKKTALQEKTELAGFLNIDKCELVSEMDRGSIKLETLRDAGDALEGPEQRAAAYLLYLVSCTIFADKSLDRAQHKFLPLLVDVNNVSEYAWGAATLATLYRRLGEASRAECKQMSGCLTLLQCWIYEYFPDYRPQRSRKYDATMPGSCRWKSDAVPNKDDEKLFEYRIELDRMEIEQVIFMPYGPLDFEGSQLKTSMFHGCLSCLDDIGEPYMPCGVARQFGRVQGVPSPVIEPDRAYRLAGANRYRVQYPTARWAWRERHTTHRIPLQNLGPPARYPGECTDEYMLWYVDRVHQIVCPPNHWYLVEKYPRRGVISGQDYPPHQLINKTIPLFRELETTHQDVPPEYYSKVMEAFKQLTLHPPRLDEAIFGELQEEDEEEDPTWDEDDAEEDDEECDEDDELEEEDDDGGYDDEGEVEDIDGVMDDDDC